MTQLPIIILTRPQMGENIGAAARVMANFGFSELRIVAPRDDWPNAKALEMAAHAKPLVESAQLYDTVKDAIADCQYVYATTARARAMHKPVIELPDVRTQWSVGETAQREVDESQTFFLPPTGSERCRIPPLRSPLHRGLAAREFDTAVSSSLVQGEECTSESSARRVGGKTNTAILFGPERTGLTNEEVVLADAVLTIPLAPDYPSLNLAMAVGVVCYQLSVARNQDSGCVDSSSRPLITSQAQGQNKTTHGELHGLFDQLEVALDAANFWRVEEKKPAMWQNIRTSLQRAELTSQEVATWRGIITALSNM